MSKKSLFLSCMIAVVSGPVFAQAPPTPLAPSQTVSPSPRGANNCAPTETTPQGDIAVQGSTTGQRSEALGDKLAKSDGVLCPPAGVDPAIRTPAPDSGRTPVIPPPGSPGGDPTVRPK